MANYKIENRKLETKYKRMMVLSRRIGGRISAKFGVAPAISRALSSNYSIFDGIFIIFLT